MVKILKKFQKDGHMSQINYNPEHYNDFEKNVEEAKKWGIEHNTNLQKKLNHQELTTLMLLQKTNISVKINDYLKKYRGKGSEQSSGSDFEKYTNEEKAQIVEMNKNVDLIDEIFKKAPIEKSMYVYERLPQESLNNHHLSLLNSDNTINAEVATSIVNEWKGEERKNYAYLWASTNDHQDHEGNMPIIFRINLPQGTHAFYLPDYKQSGEEVIHNILIERNLNLKFVNFQIINEKNKQALKVDVSVF